MPVIEGRANVEFGRAVFDQDLLDEMAPLLRGHFLEIAHYPDIPLDPDFAGYEAAAKSGGLRIFTARDGVRLVGYAVFFVRHNPHYKGSLQAVQDILYVDPSFRMGMTGYRFIRWCDGQLKAEGVQAVYHHVKEAHNFGAMLERMGYELVDLVYARRLD